MFENKKGRQASTIEDAQNYLWQFIAENLTITDPKVREHAHDFDLYLPWLLQIFDRHGEQPGEKLTLPELQALYMDAAWDLVQRGFLRPGPRFIDGEQTREGYGNGYSLTAKGKQFVKTVSTA